MIARIVDNNIVWIGSHKEKYLSYDAFLDKECVNPRMADDSLGPYYDHYFKEIVVLWKNRKDRSFSAETIFGIEKEVFIECLESYVQAGYDDREFPILMYDLTYFVANNIEGRPMTRYDIFVGFIGELSKLLR